jgi:hypothetical protein
MAHRIFTAAAIGSTALFVFTIFLLVATACDLGFWQNRIVSVPITANCRATVQYAHIWFFNDAEYGPYHGSIIAISDGKGNTPTVSLTGFGETLGIYYRHIRWLRSGGVIWTLAISLAYPLVIFGILPAAWIWFRWRKSRQRKIAPRCGVQP